jgi:hypothetical protein
MLAGKPVNKIPTGTPKHIRKDNIKLYLKVECENVDWTHLQIGTRGELF